MYNTYLLMYRMDGWIVCEEYKDILLAAWDEEQEIIREKEQQVSILPISYMYIYLS
jgi:hypothetical protein